VIVEQLGRDDPFKEP